MHEQVSENAGKNKLSVNHYTPCNIACGSTYSFPGILHYPDLPFAEIPEGCRYFENNPVGHM
jgi:hypothetical protein